NLKSILSDRGMVGVAYAPRVAGKVLLQGNISPLNLYQGTANEVEEETMHLLEVLAPYGGIILGDGYNVAPGTTISNLEVLRKTSEKFGKPNLQRKRSAVRTEGFVV
ncbi:MAG: uroporphyrinogen decarboxylase family protein, partial [Bacteroidota bacterium]